MREIIYDMWNSVMDAERNPLRHIQSLQVRHMIMQILAWMWCCTFAQLIGSWWIFGFSAIAHLILIGMIAITVRHLKLLKGSQNFLVDLVEQNMENMSNTI